MSSNAEFRSSTSFELTSLLSFEQRVVAKGKRKDSQQNSVDIWKVNKPLDFQSFIRCKFLDKTD